MKLLDQLDAYGTNDPEFNEGQPEDRCPVCERPVIDHWFSHLKRSAKWPHRRAALLSIILDWLRR